MPDGPTRRRPRTPHKFVQQEWGFAVHGAKSAANSVHFVVLCISARSIAIIRWLCDAGLSCRTQTVSNHGGALARHINERPAGSDELQLSRDVSTEYYNKKLRKRSHKKIILSVLAALVVVLAGATMAIASYIQDIDTKITGRVDKNLQGVLTVQEPGKPFYLLLIGVDKDEGRMSDPTYGTEDSGYRSDSIMLTRIDPGDKKVTMVSIHRDTMYDFKEYGVEKINAAYTIGQETFTTQTISEFANVPIAHYAEVDMDGLAAVIDCIGGIDVTLDMDVYDPEYTGIDLKAGEHHLDGYTAALFCR